MTDRTDPFEELAALFLTEPDAAAQSQAAADPTWHTPGTRFLDHSR